MQVSDTQSGTDATRKSIIKRLYTGFEFEDTELEELIELYLQVREVGGTLIPSFSESESKYDLEDMAGSHNHVSNIYEILKDGVPRTTASWRNLSTGVKEESALERELYERFNCSPSARAIGARISNIRNDTSTRPSVVYATETISMNGKKYKRRFYFLIEDGLGRSGTVSINECPLWHLRRNK